MAQKIINYCDICNKKIEKVEQITIPTILRYSDEKIQKYEDVYEIVTKPYFDKIKKIDLCGSCLIKIFESL